jgi:nitrogenase-stabilizing/protective protein
MTINQFDHALRDLSSAEDFLDYFAIDYDPAVVQVKRLSILQRWHNILQAQPIVETADEDARYQHYAITLAQAYHDMLTSDAKSEHLFRVFQQSAPQPVHIPVQTLFKGIS